MRASKVAAALAAATAGLGGLAALNHRISSQAPSLNPQGALPGESKRFNWFGNPIAYTVAGTGQPVVLLHGFGAGADSFQWQKLFPLLAGRYQVYAYDQLGFGLSDRPDMNFQADWYVHLLEYFLERIVGRPALVVASSLAGAHAILAAAERPELITHLVLLAPTGTIAFSQPPSLWQVALGRLLHLPIIGQSLYYALTSRPAIRHQVYDNLYADPVHVDAPLLLPHLYASSHQPGARYAVATFIGGQLNADAGQALAQLTQPVIIVWGEQAKMTPVWQARSFVDINPRVRLLTGENAGICIESERPEVVQKAIEEALAGNESPSLLRERG